MRIPRPQIINSNDEHQEAFSTYCPKCGCHKIRKGDLGGQDFDENGWYQVQNFQCLDPKCSHKWGEKVVIASGGATFKHSS
jgi:predicted nucleic-acid-binding Zn-ribbon protein